MPDPIPSPLRLALDRTHDTGRLQRALDLGRDASTSHTAVTQLDGLSVGDVYERRLALLANYTLRDGRRVLRSLEDPSRRVRSLAFALVPLCCDDNQCVDALQVAFSLRRDRALASLLRARDRASALDRHLDWLSTAKGIADFADFVPLASPTAIRKHLAQALSRPSLTFWKRLSRYAPDILGEVFAERLRSVPGELDPVYRHLVDLHLFRIADAAPDNGLELVELLVTRGILPPHNVWKRLAVHRPTITLSVMQRCKVAIAPDLFARDPGSLSVTAIATLVRLAPRALGSPDALLKLLSAEQRHGLLDAWTESLRARPRWMVEEGLLYGGRSLLAHIDDPDAREFAYQRWSEGARDANGSISLGEVAQLPPELRVREGRRHIHHVVALHTNPSVRFLYARFLPWVEAEIAVRVLLGHPEGAMRGIALATLFAIAGMRPDEPELTDKCLSLALDRKNEQDPVRGSMISALLQWPKRVWRKDHTTAIGQIVRDALDASDCSSSTAGLLEGLVVRRFDLDPEWAARLLFTLVKERGRIHDPTFARLLTDDDLRVAAPAILEVARVWSEREQGMPLLQLSRGVGKRIALVPGLGELVAKLLEEATFEWIAGHAAQVLREFDRPRIEAMLEVQMRRWLKSGWVSSVISLGQSWTEKPLPHELGEALEKIARGNWHPGHIHAALQAMRVRDLARFDRVVEVLLKSDESLVCLPEVYNHLHVRRQDLLDPFLGHRVITGRFATGKTRWILPFERGFHRWNPSQNTRFHETLAGLIADKDRDTPTVFRCLVILPRLEYAPADALCALADDPRPAVKEKSLRVMARCDAAQGVPTLLKCLDDSRARIAIYGLRRAVKDIPPARVVELLSEVPLRKVTVAKEVLRILGELRHDAAYSHLLEVDKKKLHRDVRIALLRALWDHLEREPTWEILTRAVESDDWVMASRLGDIPADRLTVTSDKRLSVLLAKVLERPEPEARIELLNRAAMLGVKDPDRGFLRACGARLGSPYDDEVRAAMLAIAHRSNEGDMEAIGPMVEAVRDDVRALTVGLRALFELPLRTREVWLQAAEAVEKALEPDPRLSPQRVHCAGLWRLDTDWATRVAAMGEVGPLGHDTLAAVATVVATLPVASLGAITEMWKVSPSPELRRAAVWCLERDAGPGRGWTPERLERLKELQGDPSPLVAGAARRVFPPREVVGR